ncbi:hypothetical protein [Sulfurisphaera ohwakuensis]|uniref:hypothetical protein n=1 Tax=Sulfurisphaera ohwakuensis TaxID=69656 RepID=UPI0036F277CB
MKGQAVVVVSLIILIILFSVLLPFLILTMTSPSYNIQGVQSASQINQQRDLQLFSIEGGDPQITYGISQNGLDYLNFTFLHGFNPLQIIAIYYFNSTSWVPAYPGGFTVSSDQTVYLFTPAYYTGPIDIVISYGNQIILYPKLPGGEEYTNLYTVYLCSPSKTGTLTIYSGQIEELNQNGQTQTVTLSKTETFEIYNGTQIFVPNATSLPPVIGPEQITTLPNGTLIVFSTPINGIEAIKIVKAYATIEIPCGGIIQKIIYATGLPLSSFLTGYQSDNDNIGVLNAVPYGGSNNPQLQSQTIVQWMIPDSGIKQQLEISGVPSLSANQVYISSTAPLGGYAVWTGDAGIVIGNGFQSDPPGQQVEFYVAFTVQLQNGMWATIADPNPIPALTTLNGNNAAYLMMVSATYNETTGTLALYINGTLVSEATLPSSCPKALNNSPLSIMDVGSVYNGTAPPPPINAPGQNGQLNSIPGVAGDVNTGDSSSYSFDGALGPTIIYDIALPPSAIKFLFSGGLPDFKDIVVLWSQNYVVYSKILNIYPLETEECFSNQQPQTHGQSYGYIGNQMVGYEIYNLVNENEYDGFWGLGGAIPTAFTPFSSIVLWSGGTPLIYNPSILAETGINISVEFQTYLTPPAKGEYLFAFNFTDCPPGITTETHGGPLVWANEYAKVYINGKLVFSGYMTSSSNPGPPSQTTEKIAVTYSNDPTAMATNQPLFDYFFTGSANITVIFTFNVPNSYLSAAGPGPANSQNYPPLAIFFGLMWEPPGYTSFVPVPLNYLETSQG